ncbi:hypothetical protein UYSO10_4593 [Kosakonia radicincitans]|nr:hypothetical protein UYSO10_4593 [Kosakonia radicincitans]
MKIVKLSQIKLAKKRYGWHKLIGVEKRKINSIKTYLS